MDVREIVKSEFERTCQRTGLPVNSKLLEVAESPFDLVSVQAAIEEDIKNEIRVVPIGPHRAIVEARLARNHEQRLRQLSRAFALQLAKYWLSGNQIDPRLALMVQRGLKDSAGRGCDIYPCERHQQGEE